MQYLLVFFSMFAPHQYRLRVPTNTYPVITCVFAFMYQARSQVLRFGGIYIFRRQSFWFYYMSKKICLGKTKFGGYKNFGKTSRESPPRGL